MIEELNMNIVWAITFWQIVDKCENTVRNTVRNLVYIQNKNGINMIKELYLNAVLNTGYLQVYNVV